MRFRVSSELGCQLSGGRRCSFSSYSYLAWRGGLTKMKQLSESYYLYTMTSFSWNLEIAFYWLAKHDIRVVDDEPFKERFQRKPMVDEVHAHMKEMLEAGTICQAKAFGVMLLC